MISWLLNITGGFEVRKAKRQYLLAERLTQWKNINILPWMSALFQVIVF